MGGLISGYWEKPDEAVPVPGADLWRVPPTGQYAPMTPQQIFAKDVIGWLVPEFISKAASDVDKLRPKNPEAYENPVSRNRLKQELDQIREQ